MDAETERQRGVELGRRWAEHASAHELATMVSGSFDDLSQILPSDTSDHFVGGFREGVLRVWRSLGLPQHKGAGMGTKRPCTPIVGLSRCEFYGIAGQADERWIIERINI